MLTFNIPGYAELCIEHLVLDFNGTLAVDGVPLAGVHGMLVELARSVNVHIITADTHGGVKTHFQDDNIAMHILATEDQCQQKLDFVTRLGAARTIAIGNGYNDHLMLKEAALGIAILQKEGLAGVALMNADLVFDDILDALDCLKHPMRLVASLRR
jgi:soluble P-type ATPase